MWLCTQRVYWSDVKERKIMSASVNSSDKQTLLDATQGLGFVEGKLMHLCQCVSVFSLSLSLLCLVFNTDKQCML